MNWTELDKKYVWHPFTQEKTSGPALHVVGAKDARLILEDGKELLDCNSSWWVNIHGHGNETIRKAMSEQFAKIDHIIFAGATHEAAIQLAKTVAELLPNDLEKVFFSDNGSTAVEVALKMVIQYWYNKNVPRKKILAMEGAYHGDTFGAMSAGQRGYFNEPFEEYFFDVDFIPFPEQDEKAVLEMAFEKLQTKEYAAVIVEPLVQGSAGMRMYSESFLDQFVQYAKSSNTLVVFDEVMTAWGRTGKLFAMNHCKEHPDIVCLSKGLTGGVLPLGLTVATRTIYDAFYSEDKRKALLHGHSFTGNAIACSVANTSIQLLLKEKTVKSIERISRLNEKFKKKLEKKFPKVKVRTLGTILALEMDTEENGYFASMRDNAYDFFIKNGLLIRPLGNVIFVNPPFCLTDLEYAKIEKVILMFLELNRKPNIH